MIMNKIFIHPDEVRIRKGDTIVIYSSNDTNRSLRVFKRKSNGKYKRIDKRALVRKIAILEMIFDRS